MHLVASVLLFLFFFLLQIWKKRDAPILLTDRSLLVRSLERCVREKEMSHSVCAPTFSVLIGSPFPPNKLPRPTRLWHGLDLTIVRGCPSYDNPSRRVRALRKRLFGDPSEYETVRVHITEGGTKYFDFECIGYSYADAVDAFEESGVALPETYAQCIAAAASMQ